MKSIKKKKQQQQIYPMLKVQISVISCYGSCGLPHSTLFEFSLLSAIALLTWSINSDLDINHPGVQCIHAGYANCPVVPLQPAWLSN